MLPAQILAVALLAASSAIAQSCLFLNNTPPGTNLSMTDDSTRVIALPFAFPFNGVNYSVITVSSNGFVWFGINTNSDLSDSEAELLAQGPRIAVYWDDLNPASTALPAGGGVYYNRTATQASVIWKDVPRFGSTTIFMNMELVLSVSGQIDLHYAANHGVSILTAITGITAGNAALPNQLDLSALPTSASPLINGGTGYELFTTTFDLVGTTTSLIPVSATGYLAVNQPLSNCPTNTPPVLPTYPNGTATSYGIGCPAPMSGNWFEEFPTGTFDLSNTSWRFTAAGGSLYAVGAGTGFDTSYTAADVRVQGDDTQVACSLTAMGGFPFMSGTLTSVATCSNGYIWMTPNTTNDFSPTAGELASLNPRLAPCWGDWTFVATGTFYWTQTATHCMATWENVPAYGVTTSQNTFQCKLYANGDIEFNYGTVLNNSTTTLGVALTGISGGNGVALAPTNISAVTSAIVNITPAQASPMLHMSTLPRVGQSYDLTTSVLPAGSILGATLVGFTQSAFDLGPLGAPGCMQLVNNLAVVLNVLGTATTFTNSVQIPLDLSFVGVTLTSQGAAYAPGVNALDAATSNGRLGTIGL